MQQTWIIAYITIVIIMAHGYAEDLVVSVIPISSDFNETQVVQVDLNYKNPGTDPAFIYDWYLPDYELTDQIFEITRDGKDVEYVGPVMKRAASAYARMVALMPGADVSTRVNLSSVYNMNETGNYTIKFKAYAGPTLVTSSRRRRSDGTPSVAVNGDILQSDSTSVFVVGRRNALAETSAQTNLEGKAGTYSYSGCLATQKQSVTSGLQAAVNYGYSAAQYVSVSRTSGTSRYTTWFGKFSSTNYNTLRSHLNAIYDVFTSKSIIFDCGTCTNKPNTFAYVYPSQPYKIYLCGAYWNAPVTGTDSKGGTIIHELSHFTAVADTDDNAYGQSNAKALAKSNPLIALENADSHEYFVENNPPLQ